MKPGTFIQVHIHLVFAVRNRECLLKGDHRKEVFSYIARIVSNLKHKTLIVNGYSDHVHIFYGQNPSVSISDTVSEIKKSSSWYINNQNWFRGKFHWQDGYGAFSYNKNQVKNVYRYIENQEIHHQTNWFRTEYIDLLRTEDVPYEDKFLFDFFDISEPPGKSNII